ncbi:hypothetical protein [Litoribacillus peritrichatus]|uniref:Solute-binding protein family 3/N-terminal domain-containing protein n=1 Tax=Litoribacillus peritrichatus TaxID=718191 RepID=A0ABP7MLI1_9GAMM
MRNLKHTLIAFIVITYSAYSLADEYVLARPKSENDPRQEYVNALLETLLNLDLPATRHTLRYTNEVHSRERIKKLLLEGRRLDVQATATRNDWEDDLLTIRIPIYKGLLGYRILLIHQDERQEYEWIHSLDELKQKQAILGSQWSITPVWKQEGFHTITNGDYESLFKIIHFKRADYFPRGVNEILQEYQKFNPLYPDLAIEQHLGVYLPLPMYFFVSPHKPELAELIRTNFETFIKRGEFDQFFMSRFENIITELNIDSRRTFYVPNQHLPKETPLHRHELWYLNPKQHQPQTHTPKR